MRFPALPNSFDSDAIARTGREVRTVRPVYGALAPVAVSATVKLAP